MRGSMCVWVCVSLSVHAHVCLGVRMRATGCRGLQNVEHWTRPSRLFFQAKLNWDLLQLFKLFLFGESGLLCAIIIIYRNKDILQH